MSAYLESYKKQFGTPGVVGQFGYDGMAAYCKAVTMADSTDPKKVTETLHSSEFSLDGLSGPIKFDSKGDRRFPPLAQLKVEDGKFITFAKQA
jgi:ABC-type branched-subunit amino acid transport system substrate-binding protein